MATLGAKLLGTGLAAIVTLGGDFAINDHQAGACSFAKGKPLGKSLGLILSANRLYPSQSCQPEFEFGLELLHITLGAVALGWMDGLPTGRAVVQFGAIGQFFRLLGTALRAFENLC